jgi:hypothetical protein
MFPRPMDESDVDDPTASWLRDIGITDHPQGNINSLQSIIDELWQTELFLSLRGEMPSAYPLPELPTTDLCPFPFPITGPPSSRDTRHDTSFSLTNFDICDEETSFSSLPIPGPSDYTDPPPAPDLKVTPNVLSSAIQKKVKTRNSRNPIRETDGLLILYSPTCAQLKFDNVAPRNKLKTKKARIKFGLDRCLSSSDCYVCPKQSGTDFHALHIPDCIQIFTELDIDLPSKDDILGCLAEFNVQVPKTQKPDIHSCIMQQPSSHVKITPFQVGVLQSCFPSFYLSPIFPEMDPCYYELRWLPDYVSSQH